MEKVTNKQQESDGEVAMQMIGLISDADLAVNATLSLISLQSLITLLRSPLTLLAGSQHQTWLRDVATQYGQATNKLLVASVSHTRGRGSYSSSYSATCGFEYDSQGS